MPVLARNRHAVVAALGVTQIFGWGCSYYFPAVLAEPVVRDTGWPFEAVIAGVSTGLMTAGLVSPLVGRLIARRGGRPALAASPILFAAGLGVLASSPNLLLFFAGWIVIGTAMGAGLYDAAFAALGRVYGHSARGPIATLTLFGGFASTVCWPLSAYLESHLGWRGTCLAYAAIHLCLCFPLQFMLPVTAATENAEPSAADVVGARAAASPEPRAGRLAFVLLAAVMTLTAAIGSIFLAHLMVLLAARGADPAQAVALGTLFGPAQVLARVVERLFGAHYHPVWTLLVAALAMAAALALFAAGLPLLAFVIVLFAAGFGISWIARGTVPLALFGAQRYPVIMGRLALPSLIGQALAPTLGAVVLTRASAEAAIAALAAAAALNLVLVAVLFAWTRARARS
ncbi:MAG: MFS transporter [Pseudorhodoplanes sp.]|nr:MAG: MFS transporter [Pseudorhodoplanes sp.]